MLRISSAIPGALARFGIAGRLVRDAGFDVGRDQRSFERRKLHCECIVDRLQLRRVSGCDDDAQR